MVIIQLVKGTELRLDLSRLTFEHGLILLSFSSLPDSLHPQVDTLLLFCLSP